MRHKVYPDVRFVGLVAALACTVMVSSCSSARGTSSDVAGGHKVVSRPTPGVRIGLTPMLDGGNAGWCIALTNTYRKSGGTVCTGAMSSTGPIFIETCSGGSNSAQVVVLTRGDVAAVTVAGGSSIPTKSNSTLPVGLRGASIELPGHKIVPKSFTFGYPWLPCPRVIPLDANGRPISTHGTSAAPLAVRLPRRSWDRPARPPSGACQLISTRLPRDIVAIEGVEATRVRPFPELLGQAFTSCAETTYFYQDEHDLPAAVLLDAAHPGTEPPGLPGMVPFAGHSSVFEAPPDRFARRIHGAWLVVEEEDNIGSRVPVELLEHLRATVHL